MAIAVGAFYFLNNNSQTESISLPTSPVATLGASPTTKDETPARYVQYTKEGYEAVKNQRHVLYFYANWCPTCRPADAEFQSRMGEIPEGIVVIRVNYNDSDTDADEEALASQYNITYQHTFVLLENGEVIKRWNGGGLSELLSQLR